MADPDHLGLIADKAIVVLGVTATKVEQVAFRMEDGPDRRERVWLIEHMKDEEARLRARIAAMARRSE